ncbi:MAG TPA: LuxR C-terminal-related transcriptional regulator [Chloroflexota bacterium]
MSSDLLLTTKLHVPRARPTLVPRPRLMEMLDQVMERKLCLVSAPAGSGKTTLLTEWIARCRISVAWLSLDDVDNDPARFLRYLISALQTVDSQVGKAALSLLQSPQRAPMESLLPALVNDLATLSQDFALVLDDYHLIVSEPVHAALSFLLAHLPSQMHLIIATRSDPPLPLPRLRVRGQLIEVRAADLRFALDEAAAFLQQTMGLNLSAEDVALLEARTEGWIAGLQLAALVLQRQEDSRAFFEEFTGSEPYIAEYLLDEVLNRQSQYIRAFLLQTAILHRLTGSLCNGLTGRRDGEAILEHLERTNLFVVPLDTQHRWYRYHSLFADLLRHNLREQGAEQVRELHRRAAQWYEREAHGVSSEDSVASATDPGTSWDLELATEAIDHALAAQEWELAVRVIEHVADNFLWQRGELSTLSRWLAALPEEITRYRPRLNLVQAWALLWSRQVDAVESHVRDAESAVAEEHPRSADSSVQARADELTRTIIGETEAIRAELARMRGDPTSSLDLSRRALERLPAHDGALRGIITAVQADAYAAIGEAISASRAYREATDLLESAGRFVPALISRGHLVQLHAVQGQLYEAAERYRAALQAAAVHGMEQSPAIGLAKVRMGDVLREWNDLEAAQEHLVDGLTLGHQWEALAEHLVVGSISLARVYQAAGDLRAAHRVLEDQLGRTGDNDARQLTQVAAYRARLWLAQGEVAMAAQWAAQAMLDPHDEPDFQREVEQVTLARILIGQGNWEAALSMLGRVCRAAESAGRVSAIIETRVLQALAYEGRSDPAQAIRVLEQALTLAEPGGYIRIFLDEAAPLVALLRRVEPGGTTRRYVGVLLAAWDAGESGEHAGGTRAARARAPYSQSQGLVDPISARELTVLQLLAAGKSNREIARELIVTVGTVKKHVNNIFGKLDVRSRTQAVARARELELVP